MLDISDAKLSESKLDRFSARPGPFIAPPPTSETPDTVSTDARSNLKATSSVISTSLASEATLSQTPWSWNVSLCVVFRLSGAIIVLTRFSIGLLRIWWITRRAALVQETVLIQEIM